MWGLDRLGVVLVFFSVAVAFCKNLYTLGYLTTFFARLHQHWGGA